MHLQQMDFKIAFLQEKLQEEIVMSQLEDFIDLKNLDWVCLLKKSLYGKFDSHMQKLHFHRYNYDCCA